MSAMFKDYLNAITITNKLMAFIFFIVWILPGGIQYILIKLKLTGFNYDKRLVKHYSLYRESCIQWLSMQGVYTY